MTGMRVAIGGLWHETNTFAAAPTIAADFEVHEGAALVDAFRGTRTPIGGFIEGGREAGFEIVPTLFASATPSGTIAREVYESLLSRFLVRLTEGKPDGILLDLHGAMVVEGIDDVEADQIARIRQRLGKLPIAAVLDFHANVGPAFVEQIDAFAGYDTYPHVDPYDRGLEMAELLSRLLAGKVRPVRARSQPPLLTVPQAQKTDSSPMRDLMDLAREAERKARVLTVTVAGGFPYADVPQAGLSVTVTTDGDAALAKEVADGIGRAAWEVRDRFRVENLPPDEAVARAMAVPQGPAILVDQADNIGGGSPGDGTVLLAALLRARAAGAVVTITDPEVVAAAKRAGVGATLDALVGGKTDGMHGPPVRVRARVARLGSGDFSYKGSYMTNRKVRAGDAALLEAEGVRILVRERKVMPFDRQEIEVMGVDPGACRMIVVKSALAWRAAYGDLARAVIDVDTPGICTARLETLPYRRLRRPVAPLDTMATWG
jgi:microcystin degradation protein MlrC